MKLKDWISKWIDVYVKNYVRKSTYVKYRQIIDCYILPHIGDMDLELIKSDVIRRLLIVELYENKGLSTSSVNIVLSVLKSSFDEATNEDIIHKNPCNSIKRLSVDEKKIDAFTRTEQSLIENYIYNKKNFKLYGILICLYSGLRIGELLSLTWQDIDFTRNILTVNKTMSIGGELSPPKTKSGVREIPISKMLLPILKDMRKHSNSEFVIETNGHCTGIRGYQGIFERLLKKLNIRRLGFHSLRHTFATRAIECGVDYKTLSVLMGHANAMITINRYAHSMMDMKIKAINKLSKMSNDNY